MKLSIIMHRKNPGFEVKAIISFNSPGIPKDIQKANLREMHERLGKTIPTSYRAKYSVSPDDLTILVRVDQTGRGQSVMRKMEDFINSTAMALKVK